MHPQAYDINMKNLHISIYTDARCTWPEFCLAGHVSVGANKLYYGGDAVQQLEELAGLLAARLMLPMTQAGSADTLYSFDRYLCPRKRVGMPHPVSTGHTSGSCCCELFYVEESPM